MKQLKMYDVVTLKSGGPPMTITRIDEADEACNNVLCKWFMNGVLSADFFPQEALVVTHNG